MSLFVADILYTIVVTNKKALPRFSFECIRLSMDIEILSVTVELDMVVWFFIKYTGTKSIRWRSVHFFNYIFYSIKKILIILQRNRYDTVER